MSLPMPAFGDPCAPSFDPAKPRELKRYFFDLEYLFTTSSITNTFEQKRYAIRYVDIDTADIWESLPEFSDEFSTFHDFKRAIFELYPAAADDNRFSLADLNSLVQNRLRTGISTLDDLSDYHARFIVISRFLIAKQCLSDLEQMRLYPRAYSPPLWTKISTRLALKLPDHLPDEPYAIPDVYAAAVFILRASQSVHSHILSPTSSQSSPSSLDINLDDFRAIFTAFAKSIIQVISSTSQPASTPPFRPSKKPRVFKCKFCGDSHFIRHCALVNDYLRLGKVIRNSESKVVLPTGAYVPEDVPGRFLKDKFDEWYRLHPQQLSTSSSSPLAVLNVAVAPNIALSSSTSSHTQYIAAIDARIAEIEVELADLRSQVVPIAQHTLVDPTASQTISHRDCTVFTPEIEPLRSRMFIHSTSIVPAPQAVIQPFSASQSSLALLTSSPASPLSLAPLTSSTAPLILSVDPPSSPSLICAPSRGPIESKQCFSGLLRLQSSPSSPSSAPAFRTSRAPDKYTAFHLRTLPPPPAICQAQPRCSTRSLRPYVTHSVRGTFRRRLHRFRRPRRSFSLSHIRSPRLLVTATP